VLLREVHDDDLPVFFAHEADPVASAMAAIAPRDQEGFDLHWAFVRADESVTVRTIVLDDGSVAGYVAAFPREGRRMVGYWIGAAFWGAGVATAALREFLTLEDRRPLAATVAAGNAGSIRVLEKCGFTRVGEHVASSDGVRVVEFVLERSAGDTRSPASGDATDAERA
jgi:RimJ/RimL family protein N-acetyltransferase